MACRCCFAVQRVRETGSDPLAYTAIDVIQGHCSALLSGGLQHPHAPRVGPAGCRTGSTLDPTLGTSSGWGLAGMGVSGRNEDRGHGEVNNLKPPANTEICGSVRVASRRQAAFPAGQELSVHLRDMFSLGTFQLTDPILVKKLS